MKQIILFLKIFLYWLLIGVASKFLFLLIYTMGAENISLAEQINVIFHGCKLDLSIAAYLCILPGFFLTFLPNGYRTATEGLVKAYCAIFSVIYAFTIIINLALYNYWRFPLDTAPLLYIKTSPSDALASMTTLQLIGGIFVMAITCGMLFFICHKCIIVTSKQQTKTNLWHRALLFILTVALIIPIRGGLGTGTIHTGSVYFSNNMLLNHAAVNPLFSFIEAATHSQNIEERYKYMDKEKANALFSNMTYTSLRNTENNNEYIHPVSQPNVVIIMLEGFSKYIIDEAGHVKGVTPNLAQLSKEGLYFNHFYANSFRTDRAIVSMLSGFPAQPTMSIMDMPHKSTTLPSIARTLKNNGYSTHFYYGGDTNYSNMQSYLMGTGFEQVVSVNDFPKKMITGKWGVADGPVLNRMLQQQQTQSKTHKPSLHVLMTESSHEPFDVPNYNKLSDKTLNAFAYADSCLGNYIEQLKKQTFWNNTLVIIVPDHLGAYPSAIDNYALWRYEIPFIITGGVVKQPQIISTIGCQTDIPATLLSLLNIEHKDFVYSKDLLDNSINHFAFFTLDDGMGLVTDSTQIIYDNHAQKLILKEGKSPQQALERAKAYLQSLYNDISTR